MSYEIYTYEYLLARALARVPNTIDKREGNIIYDALAPACYELAEFYLNLNTVEDTTYADTAVGGDLTKRCAERGIVRSGATYAIRKGEFDIAVPIGSRFSVSGLTYTVTSLISGTDYQLTCDQLGVQGNGPIGTLLPIDYIANLTSALITDVLIPGEDEETDEDLRARYFDSVSSEAYGGNIADYKAKTNELVGVGSTKVYPVWNGGGTVKLVIVDSTYQVPSEVLVTAVQTAIDPVVNGGEGYGIAPIGHLVTVEAVGSVNIDITFTLTYASGFDWTTLETAVTEAIEIYLAQLRESWADEDYLIVRISSIESYVLAVVGVLDIVGTTINGNTANLQLTDIQIPLVGTVTDI